MEVTVAQWWASLGETIVTMRIEFYGLEPSARQLTLDGRTLFGELQIHAPFRRIPAEPAGELKQLVRGVRPHAAKLLPPIAPVCGAPGLGDHWPENRVLYDYILAYKFSLKEHLEVSVRFPSLNCHFYESPFEAQLWAIFDANRRLVTYGDYYPSAQKLPAGDYEVRLQVRHDLVELLQKLRHMPMVLHISLASSLALGFHWSRSDALGVPPPNKPAARRILQANERLALYVTVPTLPELAQPGDIITGSFNVAKLAPEALGATKRPSGFGATLIVPPAEIKDEKVADDKDDTSNDPASAKALDEAVRALKITQLATLADSIKKLTAKQKEDKEKKVESTEKKVEEAKVLAASVEEVRERYDAMLASLRAECVVAVASEQTITLMCSHLANMDTICSRSNIGELMALVALSDDILGLFDRDALAATLGVNHDKDDKAQSKQRKKDEAKKKSLVAVLHTKAMALADLHMCDAATHPLTALDEAVGMLHQWAAATEHIKLTVRWHKLHGRCATAMTALNESVSKEKAPISKENLELKAELLTALGWEHWVSCVRASILVRFPAALPPVFSRMY